MAWTASDDDCTDFHRSKSPTANRRRSHTQSLIYLMHLYRPVYRRKLMTAACRPTIRVYDDVMCVLYAHKKMSKFTTPYRPITIIYFSILQNERTTYVGLQHFLTYAIFALHAYARISTSLDNIMRTRQQIVLPRSPADLTCSGVSLKYYT